MSNETQISDADKNVSKPPVDGPRPGPSEWERNLTAQFLENVVMKMTGQTGEKQQAANKTADSPPGQLSHGQKQTATFIKGQLTYQEEVVGPETDFGSGLETKELTGTPEFETPVPLDVGTVYPPVNFFGQGGCGDRLVGGGSPNGGPASVAGRTHSKFSSRSAQPFKPCQLGPEQQIQPLSRKVAYDRASKSTDGTPERCTKAEDFLGLSETGSNSETASRTETLRKQVDVIRRQRDAMCAKQKDLIMEVNRLQLENTNLQEKVVITQDGQFEADCTLAAQNLELVAQNQDLVAKIDRIRLEFSLEQNRVQELATLRDHLQTTLDGLAKKYQLANDTLTNVCKEREAAENAVENLEKMLRAEKNIPVDRENEVRAKNFRIETPFLEYPIGEYVNLNHSTGGPFMADVAAATTKNGVQINGISAETAKSSGVGRTDRFKNKPGTGIVFSVIDYDVDALKAATVAPVTSYLDSYGWNL